MSLFRTLIALVWPREDAAPAVRVENFDSVPLATPQPTSAPIIRPASAAAEPTKASTVEEPLAASNEDDLEDVLDAALESVTGGFADRGPGQANHPDDMAAARELFAEIASLHSRPVKNFIFELKRGTTKKEWIEISRPVLSSILSAAESMEITEVARCLTDLDESLAMAEVDDSDDVSGESRELILSIYDELAEILPHAFAFDDEGEEDDRRESIIIHSLLRQIQGIGSVTIGRLYEAGLASLDSLFLATDAEMADTTGVPIELCRRICEKVQEHRYRREATSPEQLLEGHRRRLADLVTALRRHHEAFKVACEADHPDETVAAQKRSSRCSRQACALEINVVLAEMGDVDMAEELEKLAFEQRILKLEAHLAQVTVPVAVPNAALAPIPAAPAASSRG